MKKFLVPMLAAALTFVGCTRELEDRMEILESKVDWLEAQVTQINANITNIQTALNAINSNVWVTSVSGNNADGYVIRFSDGKEAVIKNGNDGAPGAAGEKGEQGEQGESPVVSATAIDGVYYWTVNGETVKDAEGNPLPVTGMAPQVKAEGGKWYASYDGGKTWEVIGTLPASGSGSGITAEVTDEAVILYLSDTESVSIPLIPTFALVAANTSVGINAGGSAVVAYTIKGAAETDDVVVYVDHVSAGWTATVDEAAATVAIQAAEGQTTGLVVIAAVNNTTGASSAQALRFEEGVLQGPAEAIAAAKDGGEIEVTVSTNVEYTVSIDVDWIKAVETKAAHTETLKFTVEENTGNARTGNITIKGSNGTEIVVVVTQESGDTTPRVANGTGYIHNLFGWQVYTDEAHGFTGHDNSSIAVVGDKLILSNSSDFSKMPVFNKMTGEYLGNNFVNVSGIPSDVIIKAITTDDAGHLVAATYVSNIAGAETPNQTALVYAWLNGIDQAPKPIINGNIGGGAFKTITTKFDTFYTIRVTGDISTKAILASSSKNACRPIFFEIKNATPTYPCKIEWPDPTFANITASMWKNATVKPITADWDNLDYFWSSGNFRQVITYSNHGNGFQFTVPTANKVHWWTGHQGGLDYIEFNGAHLLAVANANAQQSGAPLSYRVVVSDVTANPAKGTFWDNLIFDSREGAGANYAYKVDDAKYAAWALSSIYSFSSQSVLDNSNPDELCDIVFAKGDDGHSVVVYMVVPGMFLSAWEITDKDIKE